MPAISASLRVSAPSASGGGANPPVVPAVPITVIVIEGDSQTSNTPRMTGGNRGDYWSYRYADARPGRTIAVTARESRTVGGPAVTGPPAESADAGENTLLHQRDADLALGPQLIVAMIGSNDLGSVSVPTFLARLAAWAAPIRAAGVKVALATPPPFDSRHPQHDVFNARRAEYLPLIRAGFAEYADALIPFGTHPDIDTGADPHPLIGDGVHLTGFDPVNRSGGQNVLHDVMAAVIDSVCDASRNGAVSPYAGDWFGTDASVQPGEVIERRWIVSGLGLGVSVAASISGAGAEMRRGSGAWGTGGFSVMNGDVVSLRLIAAATNATARAATVTVGGASDTLTATTVAANAQPVDYNHGGIAGQITPGAEITYAGLSFAEGLAVLAIDKGWDGYTSADVMVGDRAATMVRQDGELEVWTAPVAAGDHAVKMRRPSGYLARHNLSWGTAANTRGVAAHAGDRPQHQSAPHLAPALAVPANGLMIGFFREHGGAPMTPATATAPGVLVGEGHVAFQGESTGIAVARRATTGQVGFDFAFGTHARCAIVLGPAG